MSLKLKRRVIEANYRHLLDEMYGAEPEPADNHRAVPTV